MKFERDPNKADRNLKRHKVTFKEAATVFSDPLSLTFPDPDHSFEESRFITIGTSFKKRILLISHTDSGDTVRIISARKATNRERKHYEEEI